VLKRRLSTDDAAGRRARRVLPHCLHITRDAVRVVGDSRVFSHVEKNFVLGLCRRPSGKFKAGTGDWPKLSALL
jgi:hypothetical protein